MHAAVLESVHTELVTNSLFHHSLIFHAIVGGAS